MIKIFFFFAFICVLVSCQKDTDQLNSKEFVSSSTMKIDPSGYGDLPLDVIDFIAKGGADHVGCEVSNDRQAFDGGQFDIGPLDVSPTLGTYAYPYSFSINPVELLNSSLPCQPIVPYFIIGYIDKQTGVKNSDGHSATFLLVLNPNYFDPVQVVDVNWELNGQYDSVPVQSFTISGLQIGESSSVACRVFSTDDNVTVYSQDTGLAPIIAP